MKDKLRKTDRGAAQCQGDVRTLKSQLTPTMEIASEAKERLSDHKTLATKLYRLIEQRASALKIPMRKIVVLPAWSHEYEDRTGVVIDVEIDGSADQRFSLWDAVCDEMVRLEESLPKKESRFLSDQISFVVNRG
jgi:hypothetical protein